MPLVIRHKNNRDCPTVVCDWCGREIENAKDGNYQWVFPEHGNIPGEADAEIFFTHKLCCHAFEMANKHDGRKGRTWGAIELELLPIYLSKNLNLNYEEAKKKAAFFEQLG